MKITRLNINYSDEQGPIGSRELLFLNVNLKIDNFNDLRYAVIQAVTEWMSFDRTGQDYASANSKSMRWKDLMVMIQSNQELKNRLCAHGLILIAKSEINEFDLDAEAELVPDGIPVSP